MFLEEGKMGINLLCPSHELMNYVFFQLYFSAVNNRDNVRLHRTDDEFLRFISYVTDKIQEAVYTFFGSSSSPFPVLLACNICSLTSS